MRDEPLVSVTRIVDCDFDPDLVGSVGYTIHCQELERYLAVGDSMLKRQQLVAKELRELADAIESGANPFAVTIEFAARRKHGDKPKLVKEPT